ncbi:MAG: hypothetical protein H0T46_26720 [Deltaproteobacteria bacterium]|nr:hypothetical protein [Deltaproteobacteria bacterium]
MRKTTIILTTLCGLAAHISTAAAAPAWCKGGDEKPSYDMKSLFSETDADRALMQLVAASCYGEADVAQMGKQVNTTREAWNKKLGMVEADWADVSEWAHLPRHLRGDPKIEVKDRQAAWSAYSPLDQYGALISDIGNADNAYIADAFGTRLTQLGRLGYVAYCVGSHPIDPSVTWAMCATDAAALDLAKISAEIRADTTHGAGDRMAARITAYETLAKLPKLQTDIKALKAKDPAFATMFALGETAHAQWGKTNAAAIALADALDDARSSGSRSASANCTAKAWEGWKSAVSSLGAKRLGTIQQTQDRPYVPQLVAMLTAEPNGYLAALNLNVCAKLEDKEDMLSNVIGDAIGRWPGFRGPRTGTQTAILTAGFKLDNRNASIEFPEVKRDWISGSGSVDQFGFGVIDSIKADGERVTITFKKEKITQTRCVKGHYTNRISQIMSNGTVVYYYVCDQEITETIQVAPWTPIKVAARYAVGFKPGMSVTISEEVPAVAYLKGKTIPAVVVGVEVK